MGLKEAWIYRATKTQLLALTEVSQSCEDDGRSFPLGPKMKQIWSFSVSNGFVLKPNCWMELGTFFIYVFRGILCSETFGCGWEYLIYQTVYSLGSSYLLYLYYFLFTVHILIKPFWKQGVLMHGRF